MKELGVLICDSSPDDCRALSDNLADYVAQNYTGSIQLRFHVAHNLNVARRKLIDFRDDIAIIVIDLALTSRNTSELDTQAFNALVDLEQDLIELKNSDTRICYVGKPNEVEDAAHYLKRAYNCQKHNYQPQSHILHRSDPRSIDVLAEQAISFAAAANGQLESKLEQLASEVTLINQKLFIVDPDRTQTPPLVSVVQTHSQSIRALSKDVSKAYVDIDGLKATTDELGDRISTLEKWRADIQQFRRVFLSFQGGWVNQLLEKGFMLGIGVLLAKLVGLFLG